MDFFVELAVRVGPLIVVGAATVAFLYIVSQRPFQRKERKDHKST